MAQNVTTTWRPSDVSLPLPSDLSHLWDRLQDLTVLRWPTSAEQIERQVLVQWMDPATSSSIIDLAVAYAASDVYWLGLSSDEESLIPLYKDAEKVWQNLTTLSSGKALPHARPSYDYGGDRDEDDAMRETEEAAGLDWWRTVMNTLDRLMSSDIIFYSDVADDVQSDLRRELDYRTRGEILDAPLAIGAHMYWGPLDNGSNFSSVPQKPLHWLAALAASVEAGRVTLEATNPEDTENYQAAAIQLGFLWELLKGYTWASVNCPNNIGFYVFREPAVWERAKLALIDGKRVLVGALERLGTDKVLPGYTRGETGEIANTPIEVIFEKTEAVIKDAERMSMPLL